MALDWQQVKAAVWRHQIGGLKPIYAIDTISLSALVGIEPQKSALVHNTERFLAGLPANNALLWGARGTGKSSLVKALLNAYYEQGLRIIEVFKTDLANLPEIVDEIRDLPQKIYYLL
ncbi:DUF815 domain-containing protein [Methylocucumis oryzae]|uniref:DUF815 domain-containing protein n=1 Tax=Methylocucumis oryzae TaxID=1632867 RepID=UPI000A782D10